MTPAEWLGLTLVTESEYPHEWPYIAAVIRNRVAHPRWPDTIRDVVLQKSQFSHFNDYQGLGLDDAGLYQAVVEGRKARALSPSFVALAVGFAAWCQALPMDRLPFGPKVCFYYSPRSMKDEKSPWWWEKEVKREIIPPGVDPRRFRFGEMG